MDISQRTIDVLKEAGWFPGRKIDIEPIVKFLEERGFEVYQSVKEFLEEFGMLELVVPRINDPSVIKHHHTFAEGAFGDYLTRENFDDFEKRVSDPAVPVGELHNRNLTLFVSKAGKMYCDTGKVADNIWEGWENLVFSKNFIFWK